MPEPVLTPELHRAIVECVREHGALDDLLQASGLDRNMVATWVGQGLAQAQSPFRGFALEFLAACRESGTLPAARRQINDTDETPPAPPPEEAGGDRPEEDPVQVSLPDRASLTERLDAALPELLREKLAVAGIGYERVTMRAMNTATGALLRLQAEPTYVARRVVQFLSEAGDDAVDITLLAGTCIIHIESSANQNRLDVRPFWE